MKDRILLFGGTTEGRQLAEFLTIAQINFTMSVATYFGREAAEGISPENIIQGRLMMDSMEDLFDSYNLIIDATHPYARVVTQNIKSACEKTNTEYMRILRESVSETDSRIKFCDDNKSAVNYLNLVDGPILLTTGSNDAADFTQINNFRNRVYLRMLPLMDALQNCLDLGYKNSHIICMQGSFSKEFNKEIINMIGAKYLVTKDSGEAGGFINKLEAAYETGITPVVISRPYKEQGYTLAQTIEILSGRFLKPANKKFPIFIDLSSKQVVVVGGGEVATRRVNILLQFCENIIVISPKISENLQLLVDAKKIQWINRAYQPGDLSSASLVLAATNIRQVNHEVYEEAQQHKIYCSTADSKTEGSFWFPGIAQAGHITIGAISDNGNHSSAKDAIGKIRKMLENEVPKNEF